MKTQVNIKIDKEVKDKASKMAEELGLSLSSVVNATLKQFARSGDLELSSNPVMTSQLEDIVEESRKEHELGKTSGPFDKSVDLIKHLGI